MKLGELPTTVAEKVFCLIQPVVPSAAENDWNRARNAGLRSRWEPALAQLRDWKNNPDEVADEGVLAPSATLLASAEDVAEALCTHDIEPPDQILPNGDGGVVFRWRSDGRTWSIEMDVDGSIESLLMVGGRLLWRHSIHGIPEQPAQAL
jgi:hypothetical protein